jgi:hypothetical protein
MPSPRPALRPAGDRDPGPGIKRSRARYAAHRARLLIIALTWLRDADLPEMVDLSAGSAVSFS